MRKLVSSSCCFHRGKTFELTLLLVQDPEVVEHDRSEVILFLLASAHVDFVEHLDGSKFTRQFLDVGKLDLHSLLGGKLMDVHMAVFLIPVVKSRLLRLEDVVGLEGDDVLEETAEFVGLGRDTNLGAGILRHLNVVCFDGLIDLLGILEDLDK